MAEPALKYTVDTIELPRPVLVYSDDRDSNFSISNEILILGSILVLLQILDGVLTGVGISYFGIQAEGNLLIRSLMSYWGVVPALITVKILAAGVICGLCALSGLVSWIATAMRGVIVIYLAAAIIPWTSILLHHLI
ncbi:MAG: DUF5658 family protein [Bdellovibrionota bacterium]